MCPGSMRRRARASRRRARERARERAYANANADARGGKLFARISHVVTARAPASGARVRGRGIDVEVV